MDIYAIDRFCQRWIDKAASYRGEDLEERPCRITVLEDSKGKIWIATLDWDVTWMDYSQNLNKLDDELHARAVEIRDILEDIMTAGAYGDL